MSHPDNTFENECLRAARHQWGRSVFSIVVALGIVGIASAQTDRHSGLWLKQHAQAYEKFLAGGNTTSEPKVAGEAGAFMGFIDGMSYAPGSRFFCEPTGTTYDQLYAVVSKWINNNPEKWHLRANELVMQALGQAFPCEKSR